MRLLLANAMLASVDAFAPAFAQSADDKALLSNDVQGARYELALAKLAEGKAAQAPVRGYARARPAS